MLPTKFRFIWPCGFRGEEFKNQPIRNKCRLWRPCLLTDRYEISNLYREPSIDASYQVSVHLAKRFQRRLKKVCIEITHFEYRYLYLNKSYLSFMREDILEINQSETRIACGCHVC